jgi:putative serine protease PepD
MTSVTQNPSTPSFEPPYAAPFEASAPAPMTPMTPASHEAPRRNGRRTAAAVLATALVAGGVGGAVGATLSSHDTATASATATAPASAPVVPGTAPVKGDVEGVASAVLPSVVQITFTGQNGGGTGSGIVLSKDGVILTNNHVVAEAADGGSLTVAFQDGRTVKASIIGRDPGADVAVIKAEGVTDATAATLGSSADLKVGQQVVAIGSPLGLSGTVTTGIVSALNRPVVSGDGNGSAQSVLSAIQTDAAVNPGNSGGALVDMSGRVVGINSAIATLGAAQGSQSGSIGLGFAIPIDQAKRIAGELQTKGVATKAVLGVASQEAPNGGAQLTAVTSGGAAAAAGLRVGDVVTRLGSTVITDTQSLLANVRTAAPGSKVDVTYVRDGKTATASVTLGTASDTAA